MKVSEYLWENTVPATLKNNELIRGYVDTVGEVFDEIRDDINALKWQNDYDRTDSQNLLDFGRDLGYEFPRNISDALKRRTIRDAYDIYSRLGTRQSLVWALKLLGLRNIEIDEVWVPNPDLIRKGYYRNLDGTVGTEERYDMGRTAYTDFVVGNAVATDDGTFFEGFRYDDVEKENIFTNIPIFGETYKKFTSLNLDNMVSKTPYILVRLLEEDYDVITEDYVDPETGELYSYTPQERRDIVNRLVSYFIQILQRAATTRIIFVTDLLPFVSSIKQIDDIFQITETSEGQEFQSPIAVILDVVEKEHVVSHPVVEVGDAQPIGIESPYYATGMYTTPKTIGSTSQLSTVSETRQLNFSSEFVAPEDGQELHLFFDIGASLSITIPSDVSVVAEGYRNYHRSSSPEFQLGTFSGTTEVISNITTLHAMRLTVSVTGGGSSDSNIQYSITY